MARAWGCDLTKARAVWLTRDIVAVPFHVDPEDLSGVFELVASDRAGLVVDDDHRSLRSVRGDALVTRIRLIPPSDDAGGWTAPDAIAAGEKFPHVKHAGYCCLRLPTTPTSTPDVARLLKSQIAVAKIEDYGDGYVNAATSVQTHGAIDDVCGGYEGALGCELTKDMQSVMIRLWAPTAQSVRLRLFDDARGDGPRETIEMRENFEGPGVWSVKGPREWYGKYYQYEIVTYHQWGGGAPEGGMGNVTTSIATDPYARSLSSDGERVHIVDVRNDPALKPPGWDRLIKPYPTGPDPAPTGRYEPTDMAIYELHVRDFSALDETVPERLRGKYGAFGVQNATCTNHLASLADAGLTHVHLLPTYDFGSVPEKPEWQEWVDPEYLARFESNSEEQQKAVAAVANNDAFNWGYDPVHYGVPEGSYSTDPDGSARIIEYRQMVSDLARMNLRVVCDVVYNHTLSAGPEDRQSVLDKCVPGYYHRRNFDGNYEQSTCCNNTASENRMMEKHIVDDLVHWAKDYKVDGFRFDLMGHLMLRTVRRARDALDRLTLERDGVDGKSIYMYGEGWDYAEVERNRVGVNASQKNLAGTGIGSFNDRLREGVMGGSPFGDPRVQGVLTGLFFDPNGFIDQGPPERQYEELTKDSEKVIVAMAGNLAGFKFMNREGFETEGKHACWFDSFVAYAGEPSETVNYVSAHDNETLFDGITLRSNPDVPIGVRCRLNRVAMSIVAFSQGVPFFHAGDEILRSKSLDRDSYNSGDWFNRLDYSGDTHNFGIGLPGREKNGDRYPYISHLLGDLSLRPSKEEILRASDHFRECLAMRRSSPLFRLRALDEINRRCTHYNVGPLQQPGVFILHISDDPADGVREICPHFKRVLVCVNVSPHTKPIVDENLKVALAGSEMTLHPLQGKVSPDAYLDPGPGGCACEGGVPTVPPHTVAVFVEMR
jgi:pullulanase-type alpha-1,6-glucosidase